MQNGQRVGGKGAVVDGMVAADADVMYVRRDLGFELCWVPLILL